MWIGSWKDRLVTPFGIRWVKELPLLGATFSVGDYTKPTWENQLNHSRCNICHPNPHMYWREIRSLVSLVVFPSSFQHMALCTGLAHGISCTLYPLTGLSSISIGKLCMAYYQPPKPFQSAYIPSLPDSLLLDAWFW